MTTLREMIKALIFEFGRVQGRAPTPAKDRLDLTIVGQIAAGDDQVVNVSQAMERTIRTIARELKRNNPALATTHTDDEWRRMVRDCIGPALITIDPINDLAENVELMLDKIRELLKGYAYGSCEYAFGCTLFSEFDISTFEIGPVKFEPRHAWLERKVQDGTISKITARRIIRTWDGRKVRKRSRRRKRSIDIVIEPGILSAIGECPYVCSVKTVDLAAEAGRHKALAAARLAMTAVALRWETPSSTLNGFNLAMDGGARRQSTLAFTHKKSVWLSESLHGLPHGPQISAAEWVAELLVHQPIFDAAGEAIAYFVSATGVVSRPKLMNTLSQALLWFHEGCREQVTLMAIVKFSACLDALAMGNEIEGILQLVTARLGIKRDQPIRKDGPTLKSAIREIYKDGRSRTVHGTSEWIGHDWSSTRALSEDFSRRCLIMSLAWAARNPTSDDPSQLRS